KLEEEQAKRVRERMKADPELRLFHYAHLEDKYGTVYATRELIVKRFDIDQDQGDYDHLMLIVNTNAARPVF
ncbi:hypothetical protein BJ742DRAFT_683194, partial [Cladochytrium replicatum]